MVEAEVPLLHMEPSRVRPLVRMPSLEEPEGLAVLSHADQDERKGTDSDVFS